MRIDRAKLNTLLRSGLNPDITTRKQLAGHLGLDPTTLTRWFSTSDRLGNPRFPVVPDRHVAKILALFSISADALSLDDEAFRQHCFEISMLANKAREQQASSRLEKVAERQLTLKRYPASNRTKRPLWLLGSSLVVAVCVWFSLATFDLLPPLPFKLADSSKANHSVEHEQNCWRGYSAQLARFEGQDSADPCHYGKLMQAALSELKRSNANQQLGKAGDWPTLNQDHLLFLSEQLDQRRLNDKIAINIELGKSEMLRKNDLAARQYFEKARELQSTLTTPDSARSEEISAYLATVESRLNQ